MSLFLGTLVGGPPLSWLRNPMGRLAQSQAAIAQQQAAFMAAQKNQTGMGHAAALAAQRRMVNNYIVLANTTSTSTSTTLASSNTVWINATSGTKVTSGGGSVAYTDDDCALRFNDTIRIIDGQARKVHLPDGTIIDIKADGSFTINDKNAKVIYRASRIRDFNLFINASDRIEEFIAFCGEQGVRQEEMLQLPLNLFIGWLVLEAAKADREPEPDIKLIPDLRKLGTPRCVACRKFISPVAKARKIEFCGPPCFERHYQRELFALEMPAIAA